MTLVLVLQLSATLAMVGLIWFVQVVHYPMFALVGHSAFVKYERVHQKRTTWVVAPIMLLELATAIIWLWQSSGNGRVGAIAGLSLLVVIWLSTMVLQVPCHHALSHEFTESKYKHLIATNWIRTVAWTGRAILLIYFVSTPAN